MSVKLLAFALVATIAAVHGGAELGRGWNDEIEWQTLDAAREAAVTSGKPIMIVIHKTWCGACKSLKPKFAGSKIIEKFAHMFEMVNTQDDEEPKGEEFTPDGGYIPRIMFLSPDGEVKPEYKNAGGNDKYGYFYSDASQITTTMAKASAELTIKNDEL